MMVATARLSLSCLVSVVCLVPCALCALCALCLVPLSGLDAHSSSRIEPSSSSFSDGCLSLNQMMFCSHRQQLNFKRPGRPGSLELSSSRTGHLRQSRASPAPTLLCFIASFFSSPASVARFPSMACPAACLSRRLCHRRRHRSSPSLFGFVAPPPLQRLPWRSFPREQQMKRKKKRAR